MTARELAQKLEDPNATLTLLEKCLKEPKEREIEPKRERPRKK
jgi:hypothetical protein